MSENRRPLISRNYEKSGERCQLFVTQISGDDIVGSMFRYEFFHGGHEQLTHRITSGDRYHVRKVFIDKLLQLQEDGWKRTGSSSFGHQDERFFDPVHL
jgi:hypothetical protein